MMGFYSQWHIDYSLHSSLFIGIVLDKYTKNYNYNI